MTSKTRAKTLAKATGNAAALRELLTPPRVPERERNGRHQRAAAREQEAEAVRVVAEARCRKHGLKLTPENLARVTAQDYGDAMHAALRLRLIERRHLDAGLHWCELHERAAAVWGVGRLAPSCTSLEAAMIGGPLGRAVTPEDPDRAAALWRADCAAWQALRAAGESPRAECVAVVLMGQEIASADDLREGLAALAEHFGMGE